MNKKLFILSACLLAITTSVTMAQESVIWMDIRPNDVQTGPATISGTAMGTTSNNPFLNQTVNSGRRGQGQILRLEPRHNDGYESANLDTLGSPGNGWPNFDADSNRSTGDLWLYMDVFDDTAGTGDVISSIGLDIDLVPTGTVMRAKPGALAVTMDNGATVFNSITPPGSGAPWNNKVDGNVVAASDPLDWEKIKEVRVPVEDPGPTYNAALGIEPRAAGANDAPYRLGKLRVTAGSRNCTARGCDPADPNCVVDDEPGGHTRNGSYDVFLKVNNLLITRVFNGVGDSPAQENVAFGYGALKGSPSFDAPVNGNTNGAVSSVPDARIEIRMKGDFSDDGNVSSADNAPYVAAINDSTENQWQVFEGDFNGNGNTSSGDTGSSGSSGAGYLGAQTRGGATSCP